METTNAAVNKENYPAGVLLDRIVAEQVIGWASIETSTGPAGTKHIGVRVGSGVAAYEEIPRYSTDIAAAWLICGHFNSEETDPVLAANFFEAMEDVWLQHLPSTEAAHTICLAALRAVGVVTEDAPGGR